MSEYYQRLATRVEDRFGSLGVTTRVACGELSVGVPAAHLLDICKALRDEPAFACEQMIDLCGVDYATYGQGSLDTAESHFSSPAEMPLNRREWKGPRFAVVYQLLSIANNHRIRVRAFAEDDDLPIIPSVIPVWNSANWYEREAFDLLGIVFEGHPDLRRILTDYGFIGHPFRKDFPLSGNVEVSYDAEKGRVAYQPVSIEPRTLVPRVIRDDNRYAAEIKDAGNG